MGGETRVTGGGTATLSALRREFDPPWGDALSGTLDWTLALAATSEGLAWTVESNLAGSAIDLPAPIGKPAGTARSAPGRAARQRRRGRRRMR